MRPGFWKDPFGTVHLQGQAGRSSGSDAVNFMLPPGFRPTEEEFFVVYHSGGSGNTTIDVTEKGAVELFSSEPATKSSSVSETSPLGLLVRSGGQRRTEVARRSSGRRVAASRLTRGPLSAARGQSQ